VAAAAPFDQALALHRQGRLAEAERLYRKLAGRGPRGFDAQHMLGVVLVQRGALGPAAEALGRAIALNPGVAAAHNNLGTCRQRQGLLAEALACHEAALVLEPGYVEALYNAGVVLGRLGRAAEALVRYDAALAVAPAHARAQNNRGIVLRDLGRPEAALAAFDAALAAQPGFAEAQANRGNALRDLGRGAEALASYDQAFALGLESADTWFHHGNLLAAAQRYGAAVASFDRALAAQPGFAAAAVNRGNALAALGRQAEALASHQLALAAEPGSAEALYGSGLALSALGREPAAAMAFEQALALRPELPWLPGAALLSRLSACDWDGLAERRAALLAQVARGEPAADPFLLLGLVDAPALHRQAAATYAARQCPDGAAWPAAAPGERIRLGYFSADFHDHATAHLLAELIERHDRSRFEVLGFHFGPAREDAMRRRLRAGFDGFIDLGDLDDQAAAARARKVPLDIAVDLKGYTRDARPGIFAARAAPVQISWLGYPGTMASGCIDYLIGDATVTPAEAQPQYRECLVRLPHSYQPNDRQRAIAAECPSRADCGLPADGFVFCCFNNSWKLLPEQFDAWMRVLLAVPGSVLWLIDAGAGVRDNLRREAVGRGVAPERLVFAPRLPLAQHLARHALADLFLDTLPYNAHTTASDALWAGLPVVTRLSEAFAGRVAASLLRAVGLAELVVAGARDYEALAVALARDPARLAALRQRLVAHRATAPLFDTDRFARHLEAAFSAMVQRQRAGLPPAAFEVPA
jgi:predicted O-linked N-acetylglucosamine transferase (SPINDLY family)